MYIILKSGNYKINERGVYKRLTSLLRFDFIKSKMCQMFSKVQCLCKYCCLMPREIMANE
jgi:hypothetical protein